MKKLFIMIMLLIGIFGYGESLPSLTIKVPVQLDAIAANTITVDGVVMNDSKNLTCYAHDRYNRPLHGYKNHHNVYYINVPLGTGSINRVVEINVVESLGLSASQLSSVKYFVCKITSYNNRAGKWIDYTALPENLFQTKQVSFSITVE